MPITAPLAKCSFRRTVKWNHSNPFLDILIEFVQRQQCGVDNPGLGISLNLYVVFSTTARNRRRSPLPSLFAPQLHGLSGSIDDSPSWTRSTVSTKPVMPALPTPVHAGV